MISISKERSSQIAEIGHDGQHTCRVLFRAGTLYAFKIDAEKFAEFRDAERPGDYFRLHIKGKVSYEKLTRPESAESAVEVE